MIAAMFVVGGFDSAKHAENKAGAADRVVRPIMDATGLDVSTPTAVRANGIAQVVAGAMLAFGVAPRVAASVLGATLIPTTLAGHRFWEIDDPVTRSGQRTHFLKNIAMLGGLVLAAVDTEGEPSVAWRAHRAIERMEARMPALPLHHWD
jgi:putative oxidoreductase